MHCIEKATIGEALIENFFPSGIPLPKEGVLWDYKESFEADKLAYAELVKDVSSFFNSYGGYMFLGVSEIKADEAFEVVGYERPLDFVVKLKSAVDSFCSGQIDFTVSDILINNRNLTAIHIPRRPEAQPPTFLTRNGPDKKPGKPLFIENSTYFRENDRTRQATISSQWEFLNSVRTFNRQFAGAISISSTATSSRVIECNLPDKNLICSHLFGREEILALLWAWIAHELEPVRLLAGAGGKGKTSIAYEFASKFYRQAPLPFLQVFWASAKKQQFLADRNEFMELPEGKYSSPKELLEALCVATGALSQVELEESQESEFTLQKKLRISLKDIPTFVIIDDIDSLKPSDQKRVFELVQQISAGAPSKFLLTTRANFAFSETQCIHVPGLKGEAFSSLVEDRLSKLGLPRLKNAELRSLEAMSDGSPLWTDSILRLIKQGHTLSQAIKEWIGKPGEDARAAALKKELDALTAGAKRILYVAAILRNCSRAELLEVTKLGRTEFDEAIVQLQTLFLVDAPKIIEKEPRFSVPEATALAARELGADLVADHQRLFIVAREFINKAKPKGSAEKTKIGFTINQSIALLRAGKQDDAIATVDAALKSNPKDPDLLMLKGRCLDILDPLGATAAFNAAYKEGQRKPMLFQLWYEALASLNLPIEALDVANLAVDEKLDRLYWLPLRARSQIAIGLTRYKDGSLPAAVDLLKKAADDFVKALFLDQSSIHQAETFQDDLYGVNDVIWRLTNSGAGLEAALLSFDFVQHALEQGDIRSLNAERLFVATSKLAASKNLTNETPSARAGQIRVRDAIDLLRKVKADGMLSNPSAKIYNTVIEKLNGLRL